MEGRERTRVPIFLVISRTFCSRPRNRNPPDPVLPVLGWGPRAPTTGYQGLSHPERMQGTWLSQQLE